MLTQLATQFFARSPVLAWPIAALGIFFVVYIAVSVRALWSAHAEMERLAQLPFSSPEENEHD